MSNPSNRTEVYIALLLTTLVSCSVNQKKELPVVEIVEQPVGYWVVDDDNVQHCIIIGNALKCSQFPKQQYYDHMLKEFSRGSDYDK
ncbi:MAG: hypothetical protein KAH32_07255 [Chlamydiia bacterium]|nr:hypothetical protein [Chlamydiia bacterium]